MEISSPRVFCSVYYKSKVCAASEACKEVVWLSKLAGSMGIPQLVIKLFCDSQSGIGVQYHFIRESIATRYIKLEKVVS